MDMDRICSSLTAGGYTARLYGFSAIDRYMGLSLPFSWIETDADISVLARYIDNLRFPGPEIADAAADSPDGTYYFRCIDTGEGLYQGQVHPLLSFTYDFKTRSFRDPLGLYPLLRELRDKRDYYIDPHALWPKDMGSSALGENAAVEKPIAPAHRPYGTQIGRFQAIMEAALLLSRYGMEIKKSPHCPVDLDEIVENAYPDKLPKAELERAFLSCLMVSPRPDWGLELIKKYGLLEEIWPELASFDDVDHSKEFHPEGNVWNHTLETFRHRKAPASGVFDLRLSLGLLLHDAGKPIAAANSGRRFDGHAELGAQAAVRFLERLEFDNEIILDVFYLVKNHMLPAALKRLPLSKTAEIMASPLFPALMELYRCDESSSFKGLDGYYENAAAYKAFLKNTRNPYRSLDGKKISRREIYTRR